MDGQWEMTVRLMVHHPVPMLPGVGKQVVDQQQITRATSGAMTANSVSLNGSLQSSYTPSGSPTEYPTRMSINTDAGFSIVMYEGTGSNLTLPHGLGAKPEWIIIKNMDRSDTNWNCFHSANRKSNN